MILGSGIIGDNPAPMFTGLRTAFVVSLRPLVSMLLVLLVTSSFTLQLEWGRCTKFDFDELLFNGRVLSTQGQRA